MLENKNFADTFGAGSKAPYLAKRLLSKGQLLSQYHGTGHLSLGNYITMISGQSENLATQTDCQSFTEMTPGTIGADGQALGSGCIYPPQVKTIVDQLKGKGLRWRSYSQDMGKDPSREAARCGAPPIGARDPTQSATPKDQYAARHNPFVYFHSVIDKRRPVARTSSRSTSSAGICAISVAPATTASSRRISAPTATMRPVPTHGKRAATRASTSSFASGSRRSRAPRPIARTAC